MDVHPPLAKMLIALTGFVFGLDPSFDFAEIGMYVGRERARAVFKYLLCIWNYVFFDLNLILLFFVFVFVFVRQIGTIWQRTYPM